MRLNLQIFEFRRRAREDCSGGHARRCPAVWIDRGAELRPSGGAVRAALLTERTSEIGARAASVHRNGVIYGAAVCITSRRARSMREPRRGEQSEARYRAWQELRSKSSPRV